MLTFDAADKLNKELAGEVTAKLNSKLCGKPLAGAVLETERQIVERVVVTAKSKTGPAISERLGALGYRVTGTLPSEVQGTYLIIAERVIANDVKSFGETPC